MLEGLLPQGCCLTDTANNLFSYRLDPAGRLISGGMAIIQLGARRRLANYVSQRLCRKLGRKYIPPVEFVWSGRMAITPDFLPRLYNLDSGIIAGIGCNGRGIAMATVLGRMLADAALGAPGSELSLTPGKTRPLWPHGVVTQSAKLVLAYGRCRDFATRIRSENRRSGEHSLPDVLQGKVGSETNRKQED
jgi:glycine/D-amino acid oxidase-like deaminating enzyme